MIAKELGLESFLTEFRKFFVREAQIKFDGSIEFLKLLEKYEIILPKVKDLENEILLLKKEAILRLEEIFELVRLNRFFIELKRFKEIFNYLGIEVSYEVEKIRDFFNSDGSFKEEKDSAYKKVIDEIRRLEEEKKIRLNEAKKRIGSFLIEDKIYFISNREVFLVRGGVERVLAGKILARSKSGYFYFLPKVVEEVEEKIEELEARKREILFKYEKSFSRILKNEVDILDSLNRAYSILDSYIARIRFAKENSFNFVRLSKNEFFIKEFYYPAIKNPKPLTIDLTKKNGFIITGANAGGKSVVLKSILAVAFLANNLIPMRIHSTSVVKKFDGIEAILDNSDLIEVGLSTFANRIRKIANLISKENYLIGIDEIELGTDFEEASAIAISIIEELIKKK